MARLEARLDKLERGGGDRNAAHFYILWVDPGQDRAGALKAAANKIPDDLPAYCAEWTAPDDYRRRGQALGPRARSRVTDCQRISDDEKNILWEALCDDAERKLSALGINLETKYQQQTVALSDRELIGAMIVTSMPAIRSWHQDLAEKSDLTAEVK